MRVLLAPDSFKGSATAAAAAAALARGWLAQRPADQVTCLPLGAAAVFGPQKGALQRQVARLEAGLARLTGQRTAGGARPRRPSNLGERARDRRVQRQRSPGAGRRDLP